MGTSEIVTVVATGLITGFASGLLGIGGSIVGTPLLRLLLDLPAKIALATPLPVVFPSGLSGTAAYLKERKIDSLLVFYMSVGAVPATWLGASLTEYLDGTFLMVLTAIFLLLVGSTFFVRSLMIKEHAMQDDKAPFERILAIIAGAAGGFLAGLLAIGGGIVYVPVILRFFRRTMKVALATSLALVMIVAIPGTIRHAMLGNIDWSIALILSASVIPAAFLGARVALHMKNELLEKIFGAATIALGLYFLISEIAG